MKNQTIEDLSNLRVVITQNQLITFAGSEIVTLELAEFLTHSGAKVIVVTNSLGDPMMSELKKLRNLEVFLNQDGALNQHIKRFKPNLIWVHHQLLPEALLSPAVIAEARYIFHHMSPYHPTEFPVFSRLEAQLSDLILFNSIETRDEVLSQGVFNKTPSRKIDVFGNPAPDTFYGTRNYSDRLGSILVVTNHLTNELKDIKSLLAERNIKVTVLGQNGDLQERLTPRLIRQYDAVVSIGKTVQYSLLSRTPIYCYDHFGGPGYLDKDNIELSRSRNFSGRNGGRRSTNQIIEEIIEGYGISVEFMKSLDADYLDNFRLSSRFQKALQLVSIEGPHPDKLKLGKDQVVGLQKVNELNRTIQEILRVYNRESQELKRQIEDLSRRNLQLEADQKRNDEYISKLHSSLPYRIYSKFKKATIHLKKRT